MRNWQLFTYLQVVIQFYWAIDAISSYTICISALRVISREIIVMYIAYCLHQLEF